ncbi:MAG: hypothetical protein IKF77_02375, partial [Thermoguttaceae bacterium]|nr:hypothetical protein [Thermoguttaceae bacterium]
MSVYKDLDKVKNDVDRFGSKCYDSFNSVAYALESAFSVAKNSISGLVGSFADYGDRIAKMSERTGIAAQSLSEFEYIAGQCGTSLDTFETAIKTMEKTLAGAASGAADAQKKLANIGVALYDIQWKSPDQQFRTIAEAIASLPDPSQRAAAARNVGQILTVCRDGTVRLAGCDPDQARLAWMNNGFQLDGCGASTNDYGTPALLIDGVASGGIGRCIVPGLCAGFLTYTEATIPELCKFNADAGGFVSAGSDEVGDWKIIAASDGGDEQPQAGVRAADRAWRQHESFHRQKKRGTE